MECRTNATEGQLLVYHPKGAVTNVDCRPAFFYLNVYEIDVCERPGQLYRFVIFNTSLAVDGFWSCKRVHDRTLRDYEGSDTALVNISKLPILTCY